MLGVLLGSTLLCLEDARLAAEYAAYHGSLQVLKYITQTQGVYVQLSIVFNGRFMGSKVSCHGGQLLLNAIDGNKVDVVRWLLAGDMRVDCRGCLELACVRGNVEVCRVLVRYGRCGGDWGRIREIVEGSGNVALRRVFEGMW